MRADGLELRQEGEHSLLKGLVEEDPGHPGPPGRLGSEFHHGGLGHRVPQITLQIDEKRVD
jgi:hypothetical protein